MNNKFFPHQGGGSINTKQTYDAPYNYQPDQPVALDSRAVISEWSDDALKSMTNNDIYAGMQIYCLADKKNRICRWVPGEGKYSGLYCIWDVIHTSDEDAWVDIREMESEQPVTLLSKRIEQAELTKWRFSISDMYQYFGFYNLGDSEEEIIKNLNNEELGTLNQLLNYFIFNSNNDNEMTSFDTKFRNHTADFSSKSEDAKKNAVDKNFIIVIPNDKKQLSTISFDGGETNKTITSAIDKTLKVISTEEPYILNNVAYKIYVVIEKLNEIELDNLSIKLTYA